MKVYKTRTANCHHSILKTCNNCKIESICYCDLEKYPENGCPLCQSRPQEAPQDKEANS